MVMVGYYSIKLAVCVSVCMYVCLSVFSFPDNNLSKCQCIFTKHVYASILWRSGLVLLMDKFPQFLTELSAQDRSIFSFPDGNFSKYQWIFTKLGVCTDIVEICFGIADRQIW